MEKISNILRLNGYEAGVTANVYDQENKVKLLIEQGELKILQGDDKLSNKDINNLSDEKKFLEKYIRLIELYNEEKREVEKLKHKATFLKENKFINDWSKITDLRTKVANELKQKTIKKLNEIGEKLKKETTYKWFNFPKNIYFYDYKEDNGEGDERVKLKWSKDFGYTFEVEKYEPYSGWSKFESYTNAENTGLESIRTGNIAEFEKMNKKTIKKIAKYIRDFEYNITKDLNKLLEKEENLLNNISKS